MAAKKTYDTEYKVQAVKLGREIGFSKAAWELNVNADTLYGWDRAAKDVKLDLGPGSQTPESAISLTQEIQMLRKQNRSDRGSQYTSQLYRDELQRRNNIQSMNSTGGRCHDNARCEAMWARMKEELLYDRYDTKQMTIAELETLIWRYFMSYWNNRRICSANGGLPPMVKRQRYLDA